MAAPGMRAETFSRDPTARPDVTQKVNTPMAKAKVRQTIGSSRNKVRRGVNVLAENCTTRKSTE